MTVNVPTSPDGPSVPVVIELQGNGVLFAERIVDSLSEGRMNACRKERGFGIVGAFGGAAFRPGGHGGTPDTGILFVDLDIRRGLASIPPCVSWCTDEPRCPGAMGGVPPHRD